MYGPSSTVTTTMPESVTVVAAAVLFGVVPDEGAARDQHVAVDDRAPDARVAGRRAPLASGCIPRSGRSCGRARSGHSTLPEMRLPETMQPGEISRIERLAARAAGFKRTRTSPAAPVAGRCAAATRDRYRLNSGFTWQRSMFASK